MILKERLRLYEASLGRFWSHLEYHEPIIIISAERGDKTKAENNSNTKELRRSIVSGGFGFAKVVGGYVETLSDGSTKDIDGEQSSAIFAKPTEEKALLKLGMILGTKYEQECILFIDTKGDAKWIYTSNVKDHKIGDIDPLGKFHPTKLGQYYSRIGKKQFSYTMNESEDEYHFNSIERQMNDIFRRELRIDETYEEYLLRKSTRKNILEDL